MAELVTPAVSSGAETTEYKMAKINQIVSIVILALGGALAGLSEGGVALPSWVGVVVMVIGAVKGYLAQSKYTQSRTALKIATQASQSVVVGSLGEARSLLDDMIAKRGSAQ
jgi:hypothetical protein